jgi:hypothetical protein
LRAILESELDLAALLPPAAAAESDVLSLLPLGWLAGLEGSTGMDAYESDAMVRLQFFNGRWSGRTNSELFDAVLGLLAQFKTLSLSLVLSTTKVITSLVSAAPDLIGDQLARAFSAAVESLAAVRDIQLPAEAVADSPQLRAMMLTEFGKEIHATFVASERLRAASA